MNRIGNWYSYNNDTNNPTIMYIYDKKDNHYISISLKLKYKKKYINDEWSDFMLGSDEIYNENDNRKINEKLMIKKLFDSEYDIRKGD